MCGHTIVARMSEDRYPGPSLSFPAYRCAHAGYWLTTPMNDVLPYRTMAYNNAWANHRLLTACLGLSPEEFTAKRTGFFPSLRATLNHILIIDHFYVDAMEGGTLGPAAFADQEPCATVAALKEAQAAVDRRLLKVVEALDGAGSAAHRLRASRHLHPARADGPSAAASVSAPGAPSRPGPRHAQRHVGEPAATRRVFLGG